MAAIEIASDAGDFSVLGWLVSRFAFSTELKTVATVFPAFQSSHGVQRILTWAKIS